MRRFSRATILAAFAPLALFLLLLLGVLVASAVGVDAANSVSSTVVTISYTVPTVTETQTLTSTETVTSIVTAPTTTTTASTTTPGSVYDQPEPRYGVSPGYTILNRTAAMQDWELDQITAVGAKLVRLDYWEQAKADATIARALAHGLEPELVIGAKLTYTGRDTTADFANRCSQAASRYHGKIRYYEPSNEPNSNGWTGAAYEPYQAACYDAIKAVDPRNVVLLAGLNPATSGTQVVTWVSDFYAALGGSKYDVMNVHSYGDPAVNATWSLWCKTFGCGGTVKPSIVDVMAANGDAGKPVVGTESGDNADRVGETAQSAAVSGALRDSRLKQAYVYDMLNTVSGFGMMAPDAAGTVVAPDGTHWRRRASYAAYQAAAG